MKIVALLFLVGAVFQVTLADNDGVSPAESNCNFISHSALKKALSFVTCGSESGCPQVLGALSEPNGGFNLNMWGSVVNRYGRVCAVAYTGPTSTDQWPGSRVISAQKANTANSFSLPNLALSTANLYTQVQPGGTLFGLQESNPVDPDVAYGGSSLNYGNACTFFNSDPLCGKKMGGVNVFGGGLALYDANGRLLGGLGVSGDSSCADHNIAWRVRDRLHLDYVPAGVSGETLAQDNIVYDASSAWAHPVCSAAAQSIASNFHTTYPTGA